MRSIVVILLVFCFYGGLSGASLAIQFDEPQGYVSPVCGSLEGCLDALQALKVNPTGGPVVDLEAERSLHSSYKSRLAELASEIRKYGKKAIPPLIALLNDRGEVIGGRAAFVLSEFPAIPVQYLDDLISAHQRGVRFLPGAILATRATKAVDYLIEKIRVDGHYANSEIAEAMARFPDMTAVPLIEELSCDRPCSWGFIGSVEMSFGFMEMAPMDVVPIIIRRLNTEGVDERAMIGTIKVTVTMGDRAGPITPDLVKLSDLDDLVGHHAFKALVSLKHPVALTRLIRTVDDHGPEVSRFTLRDIASFGHDGRRAGPILQRKLKEEDRWGGSWMLPFTIARIGYEPAIPELARALGSQDWLVTYHAIEGLGFFLAAKYADRLERIKTDHYSHSVRSAAQRNLKAFENNIYSDSGLHAEGPHWMGRGWTLQEDEFTCGPGRLDLSGANALLQVDVALKEKPRSEMKISILPKGIPVIEDIGRVSAAIKVRGGWLVGSNNGEWGGNLYFVGRRGNIDVILDRAVFDMWRDRSGDIYFATGVDHLMIWPGQVWRVLRKNPRSYSAEQVLRLTDGPNQTIKAPDDLVVIVGDLSAVGLKDGKPVRVDCIPQDSAN